MEQLRPRALAVFPTCLQSTLRKTKGLAPGPPALWLIAVPQNCNHGLQKYSSQRQALILPKGDLFPSLVFFLEGLPFT